MVHAKMPKKIAECFFGRFQIFAIFLPSYDFCISLWASNGKISAQMINCHWILHCWKNILHFIALKLVKIGQNWLAVFKHWQKLAKNWKSAKKAFCDFLWQSCMYHGVSYLKKNSRTLLITWLKENFKICNFGREISNQSCNTNCGTPCIW